MTIYSVTHYLITLILCYISNKFQVVIGMMQDCIIILWLIADYQLSRCPNFPDIFPDIFEGDEILRV